MTITRYPIVFNSDSLDLGGFIEQIAPEAVDRSMRGRADILALMNHSADRPLGRRSKGTLQLDKRARGLLATVDVNDRVSYAKDFLQLLDRGDALGGSFGFRTVDDIWTMRDGVPFRVVLDMIITEVSLAVTFPAYEATAADLWSESTSVAMASRRLRQVLAR